MSISPINRILACVVLVCMMLWVTMPTAHATITTTQNASAYTITQPKTGKVIVVSPNPKQLAKKLRGGLLSMAISLALDAMDYILDPNNNAVKIHKKVDTGIYVFSALKLSANSAQEVCQQARDIVYKDYPTVSVTAEPGRPEYTIETSTMGNCVVKGKFQDITYTGNTMGMWTKVIEHQTLTTPIEQIIEQVINQANQGDPKAKQLLQEILQEQANQGVFDAEFEGAGEQVEDGSGAGKPPAPTQLDWGLSFKPTKPVARPDADAKPKDESKPEEKDKEKEEDKKKKCLPVTEPNIRMVLEPTTELATQKRVSLPVVAIYASRVEKGETRLEVQIVQNHIIGGHHRFIVAKLCNITPIIQNGTLTEYHKKVSYPMKNIELDINDWGNR